jgi:hypothetical protein
MTASYACRFLFAVAFLTTISLQVAAQVTSALGITAQAQAIHNSALVIDTHADTPQDWWTTISI